MSSPRRAEPTDGWVQVDPGKLAPMKMPCREVDAFVEEFNRTYQTLGMRAIARQDGTLGIAPPARCGGVGTDPAS